MLNAGRNELKNRCVDDFAFVLWKVLEFDSVEKAHEEGWFVEVPTGGISDELELPESLEGTVWDIPITDIGDNTDIIQRGNRRKFKKLIGDFPSLRATIHWRQKVSPPRTSEGVAEYDGLRGENPAFYRNVSKEILLYEVGILIFLGIVKSREAELVLREFSNILRVVHIIAVIIRAMVLRFYKKTDITDLEKRLSEGVTFERVKESQINIASLVAGVSEEDMDRSVTGMNQVMSRVLDRREEISWEEYQDETECVSGGKKWRRNSGRNDTSLRISISASAPEIEAESEGPEKHIEPNFILSMYIRGCSTPK